VKKINKAFGKRVKGMHFATLASEAQATPFMSVKKTGVF
jgi:hypothetical protein